MSQIAKEESKEERVHRILYGSIDEPMMEDVDVDYKEIIKKNSPTTIAKEEKHCEDCNPVRVSTERTALCGKCNCHKAKRIKIPVRHFEAQGLYEVNVPEEYWSVFVESLKTVAKIKGKQISFSIKKQSNDNS